MILLDPDLDPYPAPRTKTARTASPAGVSIRSLTLFLAKAKQAVKLRGQVSVLLTTDAAIRKLNRQFRGKNKATDVLSFPAAPEPASQQASKSASQRIAGDLAISVDTARKQAAGQGHALTCELKILLLHGLLHLAGYDHETDDGEMARRERVLRAEFGLPLGLIERTTSESARQRVGKPGPAHLRRKNKDAPKVGHPLPRMGHPLPKLGRPARRRKP